MPRGFRLIVVMFFLSMTFSTAAQEASLPTFAADGALSAVPADFVGIIALDADDQTAALEQLQLLLFVSQLFQPGRISYDVGLPFDFFIPLDSLDTENVSFATQIGGWLTGDIVVAYRAFGDGLTTTPADTLLILPTDDAFAATAALSRVINAQDALTTAQYRGVTIYQGDVIALAVMPTVVLIGGSDAIRASIDVVLGDGTRLIDQPAYQRVRAALPDYGVFAYISGEAAGAAIPFVVSIDGVRSGAILSALGDTIRALRPNSALESALLRGAFDAVGVSMEVSALSRFTPTQADAVAVFDLTEPVDDVELSPLDPLLLNAIPRSAMVVVSGTDAAAAAFDALTTLPVNNFLGVAFNGFVVLQSNAVLQEVIPLPTSADIQLALENTFAALDARGVDIRADLLDHLQGGFATALIARPNNPTPVLNTPYDVLVVAGVDDGDALRDGFGRLTDTLFGAGFLTETSIDGAPFLTLQSPAGELVFGIGVVENMLIAGTGESVDAARRALDGDNRLIDEPRWAAVSSNGTPAFYADMLGYYSTFSPALLGGAGQIAVDQVGINAALLEADLYILTVRVTLPSD